MVIRVHGTYDCNTKYIIRRSSRKFRVIRWLVNPFWVSNSFVIRASWITNCWRLKSKIPFTDGLLFSPCIIWNIRIYLLFLYFVSSHIVEVLYNRVSMIPFWVSISADQVDIEPVPSGTRSASLYALYKGFINLLIIKYEKRIEHGLKFESWTE